MLTILVTGSQGFIGSHLIKQLKNYHVIVDFINSERINLNKIEDVMKIQKSDIVIHLAANTKKNAKWNEYYENNVSTTKNILEYCVAKKIKKFIFISSYLYGKPEYCPIDENHPINPHNLYAKSKYLAEKVCESYAKTSNLNIIILRPFNIFGEKMNEGFLISNLIKSTENKKSISLINQDSKRDFLHVDDFIQLILKILKHDCKYEIFNVGSGKANSFKEIVEIVEKKSKKEINLILKEDKKQFIDMICADISKVSHKFNWKPKVTLTKGLEKCLLKNN